MPGLLRDKVALVTGGSSGIGRASALMFAREGAKVVVSDVAVKGGEETVQMVKATDGEAIFVKADVSNAAEVEALIERAVKTYGRLDCAHNNAGIVFPRTSMIEITEEEWDRVISVNLKGVWLCMKYEIPQMVKQGKGAIVNTSSINGLVGIAGLAPYNASKHGVVGITKTAALEYAKAGIRVNTVCPGGILTPLFDFQWRGVEGDSDGDPKMALLKTYPMGRLGTPEEVAEAVVWLFSDGASFITGHTLVVDGGRIA